MTNRVLFLLVALPLAQTTPSGGSIAKFVPPVPTPASFISDQKAVLPADAHATLDARITAIQQAGLGDIAVAILPSIGDYSANQVAVEIYRTWKVGSQAAIGSARRNVGVLLLIVPKELAPNKRGECWINTGTGAEGIITDASAGTICRDSIIPYLRNKDYAGAVNAGIGGIEARLRGDVGLKAAALEPERDSRRPFPFALLLSILGGLASVLAGGFGFARWKRYRPRVCTNCGKTMRRLDEKSDDARLDPGQVIEETIGSVDYDVWVCECGQSTVVPHVKWFSRYSECKECHRKTARSETVVMLPATTISSGLAEKRFECKACGALWKETIVLPVIVESSSSSGGGGGGGGGGGSSFGGSGSTSGGGGGSSY